MASIGPQAPTTGDEIDTGNVPWNVPSRILTSNDSYATAGLGGGEGTNDLLATFEFPTLSGSETIDGIEIGIEYKQSTANKIQLVLCRLTRDGGATTSGSASSDTFSTYVPTTEGTETAGSSTDDWGGYGITASELQSGVVGLITRFTHTDPLGAGSTISVDYITMTVYYTTVSGVRMLAIAGVGI